ncbi:MAG: flavodoxin [Hungatella sp.]|nr:flavodoxin [Hungatella sp.]
MKYLVIYSSRTGNTEKVAMEIFEALPGKSKDIQRVEEQKGEADVYFVGFWDDRGICGRDIVDFLEGLHGKQVAIFGTCGMGEDPEYCRRLSKRVEALIPEDNQYLGSFICSGRMTPKVLERYRMMQKKEDTPQIRQMIQVCEEAMLHPDEKDLRNARTFAEEMACVREKGEYIWG